MVYGLYLLQKKRDRGFLSLPQSLTINDMTVLPSFQYKGNSADLSSWSSIVGNTLPIFSSGSDPTPNQNTPYTGLKALQFNDGKSYRESASSSLGDISTEDIVLEMVFRAPPNFSATKFIFDKAISQGWIVSTLSGSGLMQFYMNDGTTLQTFTSALVANQWYHAMYFCNRDENSTSGSGWYLNGAVSGGFKNPSSVQGSLSNSELFTLGGSSSGGTSLSSIAFTSLWIQSNWHKAGAAGPAEWAALAASRYAVLTA